MKYRLKGRYVVEGAVVIGLMCIVIGMIVMLGLYCHDRVVMQTAADQTAWLEAAWAGRYMHPKLVVVDYELQKKSGAVSEAEAIEKGYELIQNKLLCGRIEDVQVIYHRFTKKIEVRISAGFSIGKYSFPYTCSAKVSVIKSEDLPRGAGEKGGEED